MRFGLAMKEPTFHMNYEINWTSPTQLRCSKALRLGGT